MDQVCPHSDQMCAPLDARSDSWSSVAVCISWFEVVGRSWQEMQRCPRSFAELVDQRGRASGW